jgi:RAD54-like protein 2
MNWKSQGGVLLIGYELYRLLATKTQRKKRKSKKNSSSLYIDFEEEDKEKTIFEGKV